MITLGTVTLSVKRFAGWSYPQHGQLVKILSDGSTVDNEILQSAAVPRMQASLSGVITSYADVQALHGYTATKEAVLFEETDAAVSDEGEMRYVNVMDFSVERTRPWLWEFTMDLVTAG